MVKSDQMEIHKSIFNSVDDRLKYHRISSMCVLEDNGYVISSASLLISQSNDCLNWFFLILQVALWRNLIYQLLMLINTIIPITLLLFSYLCFITVLLNKYRFPGNHFDPSKWTLIEASVFCAFFLSVELELWNQQFGLWLPVKLNFDLWINWSCKTCAFLAILHAAILIKLSDKPSHLITRLIKSNSGIDVLWCDD